MPIFEYDCQSCGATVELLVRGTEKPVCPSCQSKKLTKRLSVVATPVSHSSASLPCGASCAPPACGAGGCSGGSCPYS